MGKGNPAGDIWGAEKAVEADIQVIKASFQLFLKLALQDFNAEIRQLQEKLERSLDDLKKKMKWIDIHG